MKIALVVHKFPPASIGGTEIYTYNLAQTLSQRHDVFVFYRDDGDGALVREEQQKRGGYIVWRIGRAFNARLAHPLALFLDTFFNPDIERSYARFLNEIKPDIVHFQHVMSLSYRLIAYTKRQGVPCLLTLHDYWFICANSQLIWPNGQVCKGKRMGFNCVWCASSRVAKSWAMVARPMIAPVFWMRDQLVRGAALKANLLIAPSQFLMTRYVKEKFPQTQFVLLENGIDVGRIRSAGVWRPSSHGQLRVTYLGALAWQKGVHVLVEAFRDLPPERAVLRIFGNPEVFPEYVERLRQSANRANTFFEGPVSNEQVGYVLADTDILAVPSLWYENSPLVIQEARSMGVPVIASAHGALCEKVRDGVDGLLLPPGDVAAWRAAIQRLIDDPDLLPRLRANVRPPMTMEEHVERLEALYAKVKDQMPIEGVL
ncbi:MAG: glycosyltransferase family 4 protein [Candidatus Bathyarchaeia archaeon]